MTAFMITTFLSRRAPLLLSRLAQKLPLVSASP